MAPVTELHAASLSEVGEWRWVICGISGLHLMDIGCQWLWKGICVRRNLRCFFTRAIVCAVIESRRAAVSRSPEEIQSIVSRYPMDLLADGFLSMPAEIRARVSSIMPRSIIPALRAAILEFKSESGMSSIIILRDSSP